MPANQDGERDFIVVESEALQQLSVALVARGERTGNLVELAP
jgi:hypothetical protein